MSEIESAEEFYAKLQYIGTAADNEHAASAVSRVAIRERDAAVRWQALWEAADAAQAADEGFIDSERYTRGWHDGVAVAVENIRALIGMVVSNG